MKVPVLYGSEIRKDFSTEVAYVSSKLGIELKPVWDGMAEVDYPETPESVRSDLLSIINEENISFDAKDRFLHSMGKSSPELLLAKHAGIGKIVDAVVYPTYDNSQQILSSLLSKGYRAIVYGGGSSVSGSLLVDESKTVSLDTGRLKNINITDKYAILGAGLTGVEAEREVNRFGFTLGNFPESFMHSTIGGWVSTKATGQESNQYGGMENLVLGARMVTSSGVIKDRIVPGESSGLEVRDIAMGSDGRYGLITDVTMKLFRMPKQRYFTSRMYRSFKDGIDALSHSPAYPSVARLSDELETEFALKGAGNSAAVKLFRRYLGLRGYGHGALLIIVNNDVMVNPVTSGSISSGSAPARSWMQGRFSRPGIANVLWKNGLVPDTLETSATWDRLYGLYVETRKKFHAMRNDLGFNGEIMAHVSHLYRAGSCIYFTFIIQHENEIETLDRIRDGLIHTFTGNGGSVTHHHGYGRFFSKYVDREILKIQDRLDDPLFTRGR